MDSAVTFRTCVRARVCAYTCTPHLHCQHQATVVHPLLTPSLPIPMSSPLLKGQP